MADRKTLIDQIVKAIKEDRPDKAADAIATIAALTLQDLNRIANALEVIAKSKS